MPSLLPNISVIIPTFNEADFIEACILSLIDGDYPHTNIEVLIVDGGSTDNTIDKVITLSLRHPQIKLLNNSKKVVPAAMNIGLNEAVNDIVIWVGAHAIYQHDYLVNSVNVLLEENCASVGGVIEPVGKTLTGQAIALATTHKFGTGNAKYRYAQTRLSVDTVFGGCWKKDNILKIGGFNESWVRNQDYELNCRLREEIGEIILDPRIRCQYYCRENIQSLARQYFNYGYWRFRTFLKHPRSFKFRQAAPLLLMIGLIVSLLISLFNLMLGLALPITYIGVSLTISLLIALKNRNISYIYLLPIIFATLHFSWALGFCKNAIQTMINKTMPAVNQQ